MTPAPCARRGCSCSRRGRAARRARRDDWIVLGISELADQPRSGRRPRRGVAEAAPVALQLAAEDRRGPAQRCPTSPSGSRPTDSQDLHGRDSGGVRFHDGREMTSADVAYTFRRFLDPAFVSGKKGAYRDLAAVDARSAHRRVPSQGPVGVVSRQPDVMGIVPGRHGRDAGAQSDRQRAVSARRVRARRPRHAGGVRRLLPGQARRTPGSILKVVPDETMRGLELRKGASISSSTTCRRISSTASSNSRDCRSSPRPAPTTRTSGSICAIRSSRPPRAPGDRLRHGPRRDHPLPAPRPGSRDRPWHRAVDVLGYADDVFRFTHDVATRQALLDEAGFRDPDGDGPQPRLRLTLKTSTAEAYRVQAAVIQQQLADAGIALELRSYEFATLLCRRHPRQRAALHADLHRGLGRRSRHAAARLPLLAGAARTASTAGTTRIRRSIG